MKICDFTVPEIAYLVDQCNFTDDELELFKLRTKDVPLERCAEEMNLSVSAVKRRSKKLNNKINKILHF